MSVVHVRSPFEFAHRRLFGAEALQNDAKDVRCPDVTAGQKSSADLFCHADNGERLAAFEGHV